MLAAFGITQYLLTFILIVVCLMLIGIVLLQKGRGGGLSGAFGGGGGGQSAFGSKTGDVLTWFTVGLAAVFLLLNVVSNYGFDKSIDTTPGISAPGPATPSPLQGTPPIPGAQPVDASKVPAAVKEAMKTTPAPTAGTTAEPPANDGATAQPADSGNAEPMKEQDGTDDPSESLQP